MNKNEFDALRNLPDKKIAEDIRFLSSKDNHHSLSFSKIPVLGASGWTVLLNGTYKPATGGMSFNFVIQEAGGPVCRVDVNGTIHKDVGRTHKHNLTHDDDPRNNLPHAVARTDLQGKSAKEVWDDLCLRANIIHTGTFFAPETGAQS